MEGLCNGSQVMESELFLQPGSCIDRELKQQVAISWVVIQSILLIIMLSLVVRHCLSARLFYSLVSLLLLSANTFAFLLNQIGYVFNLGPIWNLITLGFAYWLLFVCGTWMAHSWFEAATQVSLFQKSKIREEWKGRLWKMFFAFNGVLFLLLFVLWATALAFLQQRADLITFNALVAVGLGWLGFMAIVVASGIMFVCYRLLAVIMDSPYTSTSSSHGPLAVKNRVLLYSISQFVVYLIGGLFCVGVMIYELSNLGSLAPVPHYYFISQFLFPILSTLILAFIALVLSLKADSDALSSPGQSKNKGKSPGEGRASIDETRRSSQDIGGESKQPRRLSKIPTELKVIKETQIGPESREFPSPIQESIPIDPVVEEPDNRKDPVDSKLDEFLSSI